MGCTDLLRFASSALLDLMFGTLPCLSETNAHKRLRALGMQSDDKYELVHDSAKDHPITSKTSFPRENECSASDHWDRTQAGHGFDL
jgi:hypothetical protein